MRGKKGKSPPILSQEFVIQNHGDIVSCMCMLFMVGLMFQATQPLAQVFIAAQHNVTKEVEGEQTLVNYTTGLRDLCTIFFYSLCWIVVHAVIQEYILDRFNKRFHMSKTKYGKFNDSGNMLPFYVASVAVAVDQIMKLELLPKVSKLWESYPQTEMSFMVKFYFILQIAYWIHCFPELYFMKTRREEIKEKVIMYSLYLLFISSAYVMSGTHIAMILLAIHYVPEAIFALTRLIHCAGKTNLSSHGYLAWAVTFLLARIATISLTILIVWFGLGKSQIERIDSISGNYNTQTIRIAWLAAVVLVQAWMAWNFIMFQVQRYRDSMPARSARTTEKKKKTKDAKNGKANRSSPRAKKEKQEKQD